MRIFKTTKRPMSIKEISKDLLKEKMVSPNTILLNLQKFKSVFERIEKGVYQLIPAVAHMDEEQLKEYAKKTNNNISK